MANHLGKRKPPQATPTDAALCPARIGSGRIAQVVGAVTPTRAKEVGLRTARQGVACWVGEKGKVGGPVQPSKVEVSTQPPQEGPTHERRTNGCAEHGVRRTQRPCGGCGHVAAPSNSRVRNHSSSFCATSGHKPRFTNNVARPGTGAGPCGTGAGTDAAAVAMHKPVRGLRMAARGTIGVNSSDRNTKLCSPIEKHLDFLHSLNLVATACCCMRRRHAMGLMGFISASLGDSTQRLTIKRGGWFLFGICVCGGQFGPDALPASGVHLLSGDHATREGFDGCHVLDGDRLLASPHLCHERSRYAERCGKAYASPSLCC